MFHVERWYGVVDGVGHLQSCGGESGLRSRPIRSVGKSWNDVEMQTGVAIMEVSTEAPQKMKNR